MTRLKLQPVRTERQILETAGLAHDIWREHYAPILSADQIEYMLANLQSTDAIRAQTASGYDYYLIRAGGRAIGYVGLRLNDPAPDMFLSKLYIGSDARGKGYGRATLEELLDLARNALQKSIWLTVNRQNPSIAVYEALGFAKEKTLVTDIGGGYVMDDYVMRRPVT